MKRLLVILALMATLHAKPTDDWYVGIGFLGGDGEQTLTANTSTVATYDVGGADIKVGAIFDTNNRFEFSWTTVNAESASGSKATFKGKEFDWIFTTNLNDPDSLFLPFAVVGFGSYTYSDTAAFTSSNQDLTGVSLQAGIGVFLNLDFEVELSIKQRAIIWEDYDNLVNTSLTEKMAISYIGIKHKF